MNPNALPHPAQTQHGATPAPFDGRVNASPTKPGKLQRLYVVEERTGLKKSSVYAGVKAGTFPPPVRLSARAVAWRETDIDRWITERTTATGAKYWPQQDAEQKPATRCALLAMNRITTSIMQLQARAMAICCGRRVR